MLQGEWPCGPGVTARQDGHSPRLSTPAQSRRPLSRPRPAASPRPGVQAGPGCWFSGRPRGNLRCDGARQACCSRGQERWRARRARAAEHVPPCAGSSLGTPVPGGVRGARTPSCPADSQRQRTAPKAKTAGREARQRPGLPVTALRPPARGETGRAPVRPSCQHAGSRTSAGGHGGRGERQGQAQRALTRLPWRRHSDQPSRPHKPRPHGSVQPTRGSTPPRGEAAAGHPSPARPPRSPELVPGCGARAAEAVTHGDGV